MPFYEFDVATRSLPSFSELYETFSQGQNDDEEIALPDNWYITIESTILHEIGFRMNFVTPVCLVTQILAVIDLSGGEDALFYLRRSIINTYLVFFSQDMRFNSTVDIAIASIAAAFVNTDHEANLFSLIERVLAGTSLKVNKVSPRSNPISVFCHFHGILILFHF